MPIKPEFKITTEFETFAGRIFIRCEEVDVDRDIDWLVAGDCVEVSETVYYIAESFLKHEAHNG